jgi:thiol:disulfide interchange protein
VPLKPREKGKPLPDRMPVAWAVSHLVDKEGKSFSLEAKGDVAVVSSAGAAGAKPASPAGTPAGAGMPRLLLQAFLGGLLLNLMPTVLALLVAEVFALRGGEGPGLRERAAAAATGVVGSCWAVAALALAAQRLGVPAGWGAQFQEPLVAALLTVAAALLTLNLWGLVEIPLAPAGSARVAGTGRHLLAGLFTTPLALAWPVTSFQEPLGYAFGRGPAAVATVFAVVGFGLALPYLLIALVPALLRVLPAPGAWLPRLREGLGFLAGASAFWLLYTMSRQVSAEGLAWIELVLLGMALLAWLRHRQDGRRVLRLVLALGLLACAAGVPYLADRNRLTPRVGEEIPVSDPTTRGLPREPNSNTLPGG